MDTATIAKLANLDRTLDDLDTQLILRTMVVSEFLEDVGEARWRNISTTLAITAAIRQMDLPDDFYRMMEIKIPPQGQNPSRCEGLRYIGEDNSRMMDCEASTTPGKPNSFWIAPRAGTAGQPGVGSFRAIRFGCITDQAYTAYYVYERGPAFDDMQSNVDMDTWIPAVLQPGLVLCLRYYGLMDRVGQGDGRAAAAYEAYQRWVERTVNRGTDQSKRNFVVSMR